MAENQLEEEMEGFPVGCPSQDLADPGVGECTVWRNTQDGPQCFGMLWIYCRADRSKDPDPALKNWDKVGQESRVEIQCTARTLGNLRQ